MKHQYLLAVGQGLRHGVVGFGRERPHFLVQRLGFKGAQRAHFWKSHARIPLSERSPSVLAGGGMVPGFGRGRCRSQHNRNFFLLGQPHGHVAGVVARSRLLLLVAGFVLFVDHNQAEAVPGKQNSRARGHDDPRGGIRIQKVVPKGTALSVGQLVVPGGYAFGAQSPPGPAQHLRNESDFGHHEQHVLALFERVGRQVQVNFGFARPRGAPKQRGFASRGTEFCEGRGLGFT